MLRQQRENARDLFGFLTFELFFSLGLLLLLGLPLILWLDDWRIALQPHLMTALRTAIDHPCVHTDPAVISSRTSAAFAVGRF